MRKIMIPFNPTKDAKMIFTGKNRFIDSKIKFT